MQFEYLVNEVEIDSNDVRLNTLFNNYLKQIFSPSFYAVIDNHFKNRISFKEVSEENKSVVAYTIGNTIYVNKPVFYSKNANKAILFILHEFIHILQNSKSFFVVNKFGSIKKLENSLYLLVKQNLVKPYSQFLTNENQKLHSSGKSEILSYQMNNSVDWTAVKPGTKEAYKKILADSGLFNLNSDFWRKRL